MFDFTANEHFGIQDKLSRISFKWNPSDFGIDKIINEIDELISNIDSFLKNNKYQTKYMQCLT